MGGLADCRFARMLEPRAVTSSPATSHSALIYETNVTNAPHFSGWCPIQWQVFARPCESLQKINARAADNRVILLRGMRWLAASSGFSVLLPPNGRI